MGAVVANTTDTEIVRLGDKLASYIHSHLVKTKVFLEP